MGDPVLTIVVPTFRRPELLSQCLASIVRQDFRSYVVLVCDNSPGREGEPVVAELADERFVYCPRPRNLGILQNAVQGFVDATTPWVMEVDDDDLLHPHCLSALMRPLLADPELILSFGNVEVIDWDGNALTPAERAVFLRPDRGLRPGVHRPFTDLAVQGLIYMIAAVVRRDAVDWAAIPTRAGPAYDRFIGMAAARGQAGAYYVDETVMSYRVHRGADTVTHESRQIQGAIAAIDEASRFVPARSDRVFQEELGYQRILLVRSLLQERRLRDALAVARDVRGGRAARGLVDAVRSTYRRHGSLNGLLAGVVLRGRRRRASLGQAPGDTVSS